MSIGQTQFGYWTVYSYNRLQVSDASLDRADAEEWKRQIDSGELEPAPRDSGEVI